MTTEFHHVGICYLISFSPFSALASPSLPHFFALCLSGNSAQEGGFRTTFQPEGLIWKMLTKTGMQPVLKPEEFTSMECRVVL